MKRSVLGALAVAAGLVASAGADEKKAEAPKPNTVFLAITETVNKEAIKNTLKKGARAPWQAPQYALADQLAQWGFLVDSRVQTAWDASLPKDKVTVLKKDEKPGDRKPNSAILIEGSIDIMSFPTRFYEDTTDVELTINYVARVNVTIKDANGKELHKISFKNYYGENTQSGHDKVIQESEARATRFLGLEIFKLKEVAAQIPAARGEEFKKFVADEEVAKKDFFIDFTKVVKSPVKEEE